MAFGSFGKSEDNILNFFIDVNTDKNKIGKTFKDVVSEVTKAKDQVSKEAKKIAEELSKSLKIEVSGKEIEKYATQIQKEKRRNIKEQLKAEERANKIREKNEKEAEKEHRRQVKERLKAEERVNKAREKHFRDEQRRIKQEEELRIRSYERQLQAYRNFAKAGAAVTAAGAAAIIAPTKRAGDFEAEMNRFKAVASDVSKSVSENEASFGRFQQRALELASNSKFMSTEVAQAGTIMGKLGLTTDEATDALSGIVLTAEASGESLDKISQIVIGVKNGFGLLAKDATYIADVLAYSVTNSANSFETLGVAMKYIAPVAKGAGQSLEDVTGVLNIMGDNMVLGSTAGTSFRQALIRMAKQSAETRAVLESLDLTVEDATGNFKRMPVFLRELSRKLEGASETMKTMTLSTLFGERAITGMMAVMEDTDALDKVINGLDGISGSAERLKETSFKGLNAEVIKLKSAFDKFLIEIGQKFLPFVIMAVKGIKSMVDMFINMSDTSKGVIAVIIGIGTAMSGLITTALFLKTGLIALNLAIAGIQFSANAGIVSIGLLGRSLIGLQAIGRTTGAVMSTALGPFGILIGVMASVAVPVLLNWVDAQVKANEETKKTNKILDSQIQRTDKLSISTYRLIDAQIRLADARRKMNSGELSADEFEKIQKEVEKRINNFGENPWSTLADGFKQEISKIESEAKRLPDKINEMRSELESQQNSGGNRMSATKEERELSKATIDSLKAQLKTSEMLLNTAPKRLAFAKRNLETVNDIRTQEDALVQKKQEMVAAMETLDEATELKVILKSKDDIKKIEDEMLEIIKQKIILQAKLGGEKKDEAAALKEALDQVEKIRTAERELADATGRKNKAYEQYLDNLKKEQDILKTNLDLQLTQEKLQKRKLQNQILMNQEITETNATNAGIGIGKFALNFVKVGSSGYSKADEYAKNKLEKANGFLTHNLFVIGKACANTAEYIAKMGGATKEVTDIMGASAPASYKALLDKKIAEEVSPSEAKSGDIFYYSKNRSVAGIQHTGVYVGDGQIVDAANSRGKQIGLGQRVVKRSANELGGMNNLRFLRIKPQYLKMSSKEMGLNVKNMDIDMPDETIDFTNIEKAIQSDFLDVWKETSSKETDKFEIKDLENQVKTAAEEYKKTSEFYNVIAQKGESKELDDLKQKTQESLNKLTQAQLRLEDKKQSIAISNIEKQKELKEARKKFYEETIKLEKELESKVLDSEDKKIEAINKRFLVEKFNIYKKYNEMAKEASKFAKTEKEKNEIVKKLTYLRSKDLSLAEFEKEKNIRTIQFNSINEILELRRKAAEYIKDDSQKEREMIEIAFKTKKLALEQEMYMTKDLQKQELIRGLIKEAESKKNLDLIMNTLKQEEKRIDVQNELIQLSEKNNKLLDEAGQTVSIFNEKQEKGLSSLARKYKDFQNRFTPSLIVPTDAEIKESVNHLNKKLETTINKANTTSSKAARTEDPIEKRKLQIEFSNLLEQEQQIRKAIADLQDPALKKFRDFIAAQDELNNKAELTKTLFSNIGNVISNIGNEDLGQLIGDIGSSIGSLNASFQEVSKSFTIGDSGDVFKDMNDNLGNLMLGNITDPKQVAKLAAGFSQLFSLAVEGTKLISTGLTKLGESFFGFIFGVGQKEHRKFVLELEKKDIELFKKRNELALKKGDISEALYNTNKLKANAKEYQNTIAEIDLEIKEKQNEANAKMGGVLLGGLIGGGIFNQKEREELLKMQIENAKLELESAKKKEDAQLTKEENERQINLDARRKGMDSIYAITEQRAKINKMEAELSGDAINIIRSESASRMIEIDRRISQSEMEKDANGNTEYEKNRHNLVLKEAVLERIKIEKEEYEAILEYKTKRQEAELTNKNESYKLRRDVTEFQKKQIDEDTKYQIEQNRLRNIMKTTDDINIYNETAEKLQNLEKDYTQKTNDNRKAEAEYFESITHDMQMNYAKFTDNKALIEKLSLDNTLKLFDKETKEQSLTLAQNSKAQTEYEKARAKERELIIEKSQLNIQSILNDNMKLRNQVEISMAKNTYDQIDDIDADYVARKSEIEQQLIIDIANNKKMEVELTKDANQKILSLEIEKFDKLVQYRKSKLQEEFDVRSMTAELSSNPLDMFGAERQNYFEDLYFDEQVELKRMKAMKASQEDIDKVIKKYELKRKLRNKKDLEELKNAEIERYNQILEVRERIFDIDKRQYELEIKRRDREIDQIQKKIDRLNREKDDLEREADAQRRKFDIEDKKEFEKLVSKYTPDQEIMDALEFISNPTLNTVDDAASKTAIEGLRERLDVQKQLLENSYILENITAEDYYTGLEELLGGAASGATSALATLLTEQQKQIENLQSIGKNEDEIRVVRKSQMKQTAEMQKFIAELYQDFQDNRLTQIDELTQKELDAKDELIRAEEDAVRALEDKNRIAQDAIDALAVKFEEDAEKINKNIDTVKDTMDTFGISIDSVRNNLDALLLGTTSKFETFKTEMKKAFDMSGLTAILNGLNINTNVTASPVTATTARLANTAYVDRNDTGIKLSDIPVRNKYVSPQDGDPDGAFTIEGTSGKWFRTGTEKDSYEKIVGARFGLTPEYDVGGSFDYIPAMLRPNEVVAPVRDFKHLVNRLTQQNMFRNHSMPYMAPQKHITIQIGNVYGELNLERAIRDGVRQAAMEDGTHNAIYAINSN